MGKTNKSWHEQHRMPRPSTIQQRIEWHLAHAKDCGCRPIPPSLLPLLPGEDKGTSQKTEFKVR